MAISFDFGNKLQKSIFAAIIALVFASAAYSQTAAEASFKQDLQPVLDRDCAGCHTSGGHAGSFRMDTFELFMLGGDQGSPVKMGDPEHSLIMKAISYEDPDLKMPPTKGKIPDEDIAAIRKWILQGASAVSSGAPPVVSSTSAAPASVQPSAAAPAPPSAPVAAAAAPVKPPMPADTVTVADKPMTHDQEIFFESKVRPLLTKNCFMCHSTAARGGLRLDSGEGVKKRGKDGPVVVPGHPESSLLISGGALRKGFANASDRAYQRRRGGDP